MNKIIAYTKDGNKVAIVSDEIDTKQQAMLKFEHDLKCEIDIDTVVIEKMNSYDLKDWAIMTTHTKEWNERPFNEKMNFLKKYGI